MKNNILWYNREAKDWFDGLAIGNGRLAAMVWGEEKDIISLNHESLWRGVTRNRENFPVPNGILELVRDLIEKEEYFKATALANTFFGGVGGISGIPNRIDSYQPAGDIIFTPNESSFKEAELNIENGVCTFKRLSLNTNITLTAFADADDGGIIMKWQGDNKFNGTLEFKRPSDKDTIEKISYNEGEIRYYCKFKDGISYEVKVNYETDGKVLAGENIKIDNASYVLAMCDICVYPFDIEEPDFMDFSDFDYEPVLKNHKRIFSSKMNECTLDVDVESSKIPTDERIKAKRNGSSDDGIILLFYNFGKYLFVSSNICGKLPANLQGKWNYEMNPVWESDYHFNINLQMNYWMAETINCPEYADKLISFINSFIPNGRKAAKDLYNCRGIWLPHATDVWRRTTPESYGWGVWICAAPWFAHHYFDRYLYSGDREYLENVCYPFLKEVATFYEDYLVKDKDGIYQIIPSQSPENFFEGTGDFPVSICKSSAMDVQIAYTAIGFAIEAAEILDKDKDLVSKWKEIQENLPEFKIGSDGRLLEWNEEKKEMDPGHRHFSHLFGVYPADLFNEEKNNEQFVAAKKSLDYRLDYSGGKYGVGYVGWTRAWAGCLYARFGESEKMYEHISKLVDELTTDSLLDLSFLDEPGYPSRVFQIDGNLGAVAAINESIIQSKNRKVYILQALPGHWKNGSMKGCKVPGGHTLDIEWEAGRLKEISVVLGFKKELIVVYDKKEYLISGNENERKTVVFNK